jgi:hypothetical protein
MCELGRERERKEKRQGVRQTGNGVGEREGERNLLITPTGTPLYLAPYFIHWSPTVFLLLILYWACG